MGRAIPPAIVAVALLFATCAGADGPSQAVSPASEGSPSSTRPPASSAPPGSSSSTESSPALPDPTDDPGPTYPPAARPPDLFLVAGSRAPIVGEAGSFCWSGPIESGCADIGWVVPKTMIEITPGTALRVTVGAPYALAGWDVVAQAADAPNDVASAKRIANRQPGPAVPPSAIALEPLPAGDWVIAASVWFARGGDVAFYWRVIVR